MEIVALNSTDEGVKDEIAAAISKAKGASQKRALVLEGLTIPQVLKGDVIYNFIELAKMCSSVVSHVANITLFFIDCVDMCTSYATTKSVVGNTSTQAYWRSDASDWRRCQ